MSLRKKYLKKSNNFLNDFQFFLKKIEKIDKIEKFLHFTVHFFQEKFRISKLCFFYLPDIDSEIFIQFPFFLNNSRDKNLFFSVKDIEKFYSKEELMKTEKFFQLSSNFKYVIFFKSKEKIVGFLFFENRNHYIQKYRDHLYILTRFIAYHIELYQLKKIALKDVKTGLFNYRFFIMQLKKKIKNENQPESCVVLFLDLDNFKQFNDKYGHLIGDLVLIEFSRYLKTFSSNEKVFARYGGDEFCVLYSNANLEKGLKLAKEIQTNFKTKKVFSIHTEEIKKILGISIGISKYKINDENEYKIIERADSALYKSKTLGKNQICIL